MSRLMSVAGALVLLVLISASCGSSENSRVALERGSGGSLTSGPSDGLPSLFELDDLAEVEERITSATSYNLLAGQPLMSNTGTAPSEELPAPAEVSLDPAQADGSLAWAIYGLGGFPNDGSILPFLLNSESDTGVWIALANFASGRWDFRLGEASGDFTSGLADAEDLISPSGFVYVAVISDDEAVTMTDLTLLLSGDLPGDPTMQINVLTPGELAEDTPISFDAEGSSAGSGTFTSFTYDFGDFVSEDQLSVQTAEEDVQWTYQFGGTFTVTVTGRTADGRVSTASTEITVVSPLRELLVVYNENIEADIDLANYYADRVTGRFIDPDYMLGLDLADEGSFDETVSRADYELTIRNPIRSFLDDPVNAALKDRVKYIVLTKGIPHRISGNGGTSVDSELCLLYSDTGPGNGGYNYDGRLWSGTTYPVFTTDFDGSGFYEPLDGVNKNFQPNEYQVVDESGNLFDLNYLVSRISAYTYEEAKLIIDRSLAADTSGTGYVIMDSHPGWFSFDTMTDPVWPWPQANDQLCLIELLSNAGFNHHANLDFTVELIGDLPDQAIGENVIGYCGWGVNHNREGGDSYPSGSLYILDDLGFSYRPGAAWIVYESFAAQTFIWDGAPGSHASQGQVCDFIRQGGTVAVGNCFEPFTDGVPDERRVMERYLLQGDRWIEAAYKGIRYFSWMTVVVGDPLCQVVAEE